MRYKGKCKDCEYETTYSYCIPSTVYSMLEIHMMQTGHIADIVETGDETKMSGNLDKILQQHSNEVLTEKAIRKIEEEYKEKEQLWLNEERF